MGFGDLKSKAGLEALNAYLADRSYIEGFQPSQADVVVFKALSGAPPAELCNALRWYNQINSYGNDKNSFPGVAKPLDSYGTGGAAPSASKDDDSDFGDDLFGDSDSEEEDEETKKRLAEYAAKKAKKAAVIAKSSLLIDIKPWDDETDMAEMERLVRTIELDGLLWGAAKLVPVGYGIKKLQINAVIEDAKISTDDLEDKITAFEDLVQSMDIAAFNKI
ncbi:elongation factor 1-beta-like [Mercenaria mercenaria]|uniref:elongation factor 1-beta-like n=1 Tax=Mercenaria mercenaria TaxID=6596 RepID=UPI001E1D3B1B|nr:elongation factor 1-beta-like [Mercenaria mercenaria]